MNRNLHRHNQQEHHRIQRGYILQQMSNIPSIQDDEKFYIHTPINDLSGFRSQEFENPLNSNSKLWKHSPVKTEERIQSHKELN